eukprot:Nitzschia sp. Nitz4//scaffold216_size36101//8431//10389//NITZ4_007775-RA/size36101-snap-gene-0.17-mRNA-1//-1//CDS//3329542176//1150//frame0
MLTLQMTLLVPPVPSSSVLSLTTTSSSSSVTHGVSQLDCYGLSGVRVLMLDVHMEGNVGEEMETLPLLQELKRCDVHITAVLNSHSTKEPSDQLGAASFRLHSMVNHIVHPPLSSEDYQTIYDVYSKQVDAVILAPGSWPLCNDVDTYWPYPIDIFMAGSIIMLPHCDLTAKWEIWKPSLVVAREPISHALAQQVLSSASYKEKGTITSMSGDLTNSFPLAPSALSYWESLYRCYRNGILIFVKDSNVAHVLSIEGDTIQLQTMFAGVVSLPIQQVVLATIGTADDTSALENAERMQRWRQRYPSFQSHQLVVLSSVEQLHALIQQTRETFTDQYHPGVVAFLRNKTCSLLSNPAEQAQLLGLYQLATRSTTPVAKKSSSKALFENTVRDDFIPQAFQLLRDTLRQLHSSKPSLKELSAVETVPSEEKPHAIVVGLPKSDAVEYPCAGGRQISDQIRENMLAGKPIWKDTSAIFPDQKDSRIIHAQLDGESKEYGYFLPQHYHLKELHESAPEAIWILPLRPSAKWKKSVQNWLDMEQRLQKLVQHHNPKDAATFELGSFYNSHTNLIRQFCKDHRRPNQCIEVDIENPDTGTLLVGIFPGADPSCWGQHNAGPFFQVVQQSEDKAHR